MSPDAYLICATPRSGSTLLCGLLESSGVAGHPASYFRRPSLDEMAADLGVVRAPDGRIDDAFLAAAIAAGRTPNGVFAARVMAESLPELVDDLAVLGEPGRTDLALLTERFGRLRFVHLRRVDVLAQAVSRARAEQTHFWHPGEVIAPGAQEPHYDADLIAAAVAEIERHERQWAAWFAGQGIRPIEVTYEDLAADPVGTARTTLASLGLDLAEARPLVVKARRQADALNADWIARFRSR